jgi:hypothetical protein
MRTRGEARRGAAAAAGQHAALSAAVKRSVGEGASELEAALAAVGPPGSPPLLAALATDDHALLRWACRRSQLNAVPPLLRAYGEAPDACAAAMRVLDVDDLGPCTLWGASRSGNFAAAAALLGAYRRAGRAQQALAAGGHSALHNAAASNKAESLEILRLLLEEYGEPGSAPVLAALAAASHQALWWCTSYNGGSARAAALLAAAYGPPGCAALREALSAISPLNDVFTALTDPDIHPDYRARVDATLAALLAALGEPDCAMALRELGAWLAVAAPNAPAQRLAEIPPDSLLARLAVAAPAAWALNPDAARALLSAPVRSSLALPALLALRRLPGGVAAPVAAHLRARPWLLFGAAATAPVAAAAQPLA